MAFGKEIRCRECDTDCTPMWHKESSTEFICQTCFVQKQIEAKKVDNSAVATGQLPNGSKTRNALKSKLGPKRKMSSTKSTRYRLDKSRRSIYKSRKVPKARMMHAEDHTCETVFYKGQYFQVGDIVSLVDKEDKQTYYAQCIGFMVDIYAKKSVCYQWLLPTETWTPKEGFVAHKFHLGPSDNLFHNMDSITYVCNAPVDYFKPQGYQLIHDNTHKKNTISLML